jgi:hypothetical protein
MTIQNRSVLDILVFYASEFLFLCKGMAFFFSRVVDLRLVIIV